MNHSLWPAIGGIAIAIAITTTMDATGYAAFSALSLFPLATLFWYLQGFSRREIVLVWGGFGDYGWAFAYPIAVLGAMAAIAWLFGAVNTSETDWHKTLLNTALMSSSGVLVGLLTEEGFFRGWLWASLKRAGKSDFQVLIWSTLAFTAWHISVITLDTGFNVPAAEVPVYLINATLIGGVFGVLRWVSGSVVVPSLCHAVWNGIDYPFFGFGEKVGALGIEQTHIYGPEVGVLGIALNVAFAVFLWRIYVTKIRSQKADLH
jgi:membrane protease YdiL (CAAX protease family)